MWGAIPGLALGMDEILSRYSDHYWQGRRWSWVDPLKDIQATTTAIQAGLKTPQQAAAELGCDLEDILDQLAAAKAMATEKGLGDLWSKPTGGQQTAPTETTQPDPAANAFA